MRIAFFVHLNSGPESGVYKKIVGQLKTWLELGHDVKGFVITRAPAVRESLANSHLRPALDIEYYTRGGFRSAPERYRAFRALAGRVISWKPALIYSRDDIWYAQISRMARFAPLVREINSDDLGEFGCQWSLHRVYNLLTRGLALSAAAGLVYVCGELARLPQFSKFGKPHLVLGNGISISKFVPLPPAPPARAPRLVFIGERGMPWHGTDKILTLAAAFPDWSFDIIGFDYADLGPTVPPNVKAFGPLRHPDYVSRFGEADCAIGTLALHRKNMHEASPLKTREYLAYGLPVITGYEDTDFPHSAEFLLSLPNCENNILPFAEQIESFVQRWRGRRVERAFLAHLDSTTKEKTRLDFLSEIAARGVSRVAGQPIVEAAARS